MGFVRDGRARVRSGTAGEVVEQTRRAEPPVPGRTYRLPQELYSALLLEEGASQRRPSGALACRAAAVPSPRYARPSLLTISRAASDAEMSVVSTTNRAAGIPGLT